MQRSVALTISLAAAEAIPSLEAAIENCESAAAFAEREVGDAVTEWWTQPAVHAIPWLKRELSLFLLSTVGISSLCNVFAMVCTCTLSAAGSKCRSLMLKTWFLMLQMTARMQQNG